MASSQKLSGIKGADSAESLTYMISLQVLSQQWMALVESGYSRGLMDHICGLSRTLPLLNPYSVPIPTRPHQCLPSLTTFYPNSSLKITEDLSNLCSPLLP